MANPPKIPVSSASTTSTNPQTARDLQDQITLALLANGGIARIQTALRQRLDEAGDEEEGGCLSGYDSHIWLYEDWTV